MADNIKFWERDRGAYTGTASLQNNLEHWLVTLQFHSWEYTPQDDAYVQQDNPWNNVPDNTIHNHNNQKLEGHQE